MEAVPYHDLVTPRGAAPPEQLLLVLHGILGQGSNWRTFARRLAVARPDWGAALVDLRAHGDSRALDGPDDLQHAADDLARLRERLPAPARAVIGHSFGGKVALKLLARDPGPLRTVISVDSLPGARPDRAGGEGVDRVVEMIGALPPRFDRRDEFVAHVVERGFSRPLGLWLSQSLDREPDGGFSFGLDVARIRALLDDYFREDLWSVLDPPPEGVTAHLVIAGRSTVYADADQERALSLAHAYPDRVRVHVLADADHWVHVDDPAGLLEIVSEAL